MRTIPNKLIVCLIFIASFYRCASNVDVKPANQDSIINLLNAMDTAPKTQQKTIDSVNKAYLDSVKKHIADTGSAEFPSQK